MKLHIFNPEHEIALAVNRECFTAPHAARQLRMELGFIPAFWATDGDLVLVDDIESASESFRHLRKFGSDVAFVTADCISRLSEADIADLQIEPWGWDCALKKQLVQANKNLLPLMPGDDRLRQIRKISNRRFAAENILSQLQTGDDSRIIGRSDYCTSIDDVVGMLKRNGKSVLKAPWSSSGRGVRYVDSAELSDHQIGWVMNVIQRQHGIMVEPFYNKVYDFGMEFTALDNGRIVYNGLSLFATRGGAYVGNILATEEDKREILAQYLDLKLVESVSERICTLLPEHLKDVYAGAFGVDMMVVASDDEEGFRLHPCVELNLRRTMGHLALSLTPAINEPQRIMNISYSGKYHIRIHDTAKNLLNTGLV